MTGLTVAIVDVVQVACAAIVPCVLERARAPRLPDDGLEAVRAAVRAADAAGPWNAVTERAVLFASVAVFVRSLLALNVAHVVAGFRTGHNTFSVPAADVFGAHVCPMDAALAFMVAFHTNDATDVQVCCCGAAAGDRAAAPPPRRTSRAHQDALIDATLHTGLAPRCAVVFTHILDTTTAHVPFGRLCGDVSTIWIGGPDALSAVARMAGTVIAPTAKRPCRTTPAGTVVVAAPAQPLLNLGVRRDDVLAALVVQERREYAANGVVMAPADETAIETRLVAMWPMVLMGAVEVATQNAVQQATTSLLVAPGLQAHRVVQVLWFSLTCSLPTATASAASGVPALPLAPLVASILCRSSIDGLEAVALALAASVGSLAAGTGEEHTGAVGAAIGRCTIRATGAPATHAAVAAATTAAAFVHRLCSLEAFDGLDWGDNATALRLLAQFLGTHAQVDQAGVEAALEAGRRLALGTDLCTGILPTSTRGLLCDDSDSDGDQDRDQDRFFFPCDDDDDNDQVTAVSAVACAVVVTSMDVTSGPSEFCRWPYPGVEASAVSRAAEASAIVAGGLEHVDGIVTTVSAMLVADGTVRNVLVGDLVRHRFGAVAPPTAPPATAAVCLREKRRPQSKLVLRTVKCRPPAKKAARGATRSATVRTCTT
jgi:hypothetical protein